MDGATLKDIRPHTSDRVCSVGKDKTLTVELSAHATARHADGAHHQQGTDGTSMSMPSKHMAPVSWRENLLREGFLQGP